MFLFYYSTLIDVMFLLYYSTLIDVMFLLYYSTTEFYFFIHVMYDCSCETIVMYHNIVSLF